MPDEKLPERDGGLPEEELAGLMNSISTAAPLLKGLLASPAAGEAGAQGDGRREALLLALKPYLSPTRCAAVDYFIRLSRVRDILRTLQ